MNRGTIAVPLFRLFEPDGVGLRVSDGEPKILLLGQNQLNAAAGLDGTKMVVAGGHPMAQPVALPNYEAGTEAEELALFQDRSGTTDEPPAAVKHTRRSIVFVLAAPRYRDDVAIGDALPSMAKRPMTVLGSSARAQGWGGLYIRAAQLAF